MSAKKFKECGLTVEIWETSFRVEGMSAVIHIGPHTTEDHVRQLVKSIYTAIQNKAMKAAIKKVAQAQYDATMNLLTTNP